MGGLPTPISRLVVIARLRWCSVSSIPLYLNGIPGLSDGVSQVYEGSILLKHDSGKVGRMRDPNLRNAYQVPQELCIYLLYQTL